MGIKPSRPTTAGPAVGRSTSAAARKLPLPDLTKAPRVTQLRDHKSTSGRHDRTRGVEPWCRMSPVRPRPLTHPASSPDPLRRRTTAMPVLSGRMSQLGTESAFEVLARANALQREGRNIINHGIGKPDIPTPADIDE